MMSRVFTGSGVIGPASTEPPSACVSARIALAAATAIVIGLLDAGLVASGTGGARGAFQFVPARIWVASPVVWVVMATLIGAIIFPFIRRWGGVSVAAILAIVFLSIRLRAHPAVLMTALGVFLMLLAIVGKWILRWMTRPRRSAASGILAIVVASAILAAALPLTSAPNTGHRARADRM